MICSQQHIINKHSLYYKECQRICRLSKNLYNSALYDVRQHFFNTKEYKNYNMVNKDFIQSKQVDYIALPRKVSNQTLMIVDKSFKSFFALLNKKRNKQYNKKINIPKYLPTNSYFITYYEKKALSFKRKGYIRLSQTDIYISSIINKDDIQGVRVVPKNGYFVIEVLYNRKSKELKSFNNRISAIDLGVNNLATVVSNVKNFNCFIINGKPLKSINQYYNKKLGILKSKLAKEYGDKKWSSNNIVKLHNKRNNKVNDYLHKSSRILVNQLVSNNIDTLVIGLNKEWKQDINIGNRNNQNFVQIPHSKFINMLNYKCELEGINVIIREESYTSKCSFLDLEPIKKHEKYLGRRIKRGLFKSSKGILINADINGSYNILRKAFPNIFDIEGIEGLSVIPFKMFI